jgi:phospholipid/cholesterol/gamma-HCH transport system permease protein
MNFILQPLLSFARSSGEIFELSAKAVVSVFKPPLNLRRIISHLYLDGIKSLPVIFLMSVFTGAVLALQSYYGLQRFGAEVFTGSLVGVSLTKELIPVLTGLMLAGRVSASYSAEIGTMVVTEQVDALFTFGIEPVKYLVSPRLVALLIMAPLLTLFGDFLGIMGGHMVAGLVVNQNPNLFDSQVFVSLEIWDVLSGMVKSVFFGLTIAVVGSYFGLKTEGGAKGVGKATTTAVVVASVIILVSDFFLSKILPYSLR